MKKIQRVLKSSVFWLVGGTTAGIVGGVLYFFTNGEITRNNFGHGVWLYEVSTSIATVILTGIIFGLTAYKMVFFSHPTDRKSNTKKQGGLGVIGAFLSVLVTGCPACSITIATYVGLSSVMSLLPFFGYELRIVGVIVSLFALRWIWRDLEVCALKKTHS